MLPIKRDHRISLFHLHGRTDKNYRNLKLTFCRLSSKFSSFMNQTIKASKVYKSKRKMNEIEIKY